MTEKIGVAGELEMSSYDGDTIDPRIADFEADANWFLARGWRGASVVTAVMILIFLFFNALAGLISTEACFKALGRDVCFQPVGHRVVTSAHWIVPMLILGALIAINRYIGFRLMKKVPDLTGKKKLFDAFLYTGECLAILAFKFSGGVESPMYLYFIGHVVVLSSVVGWKTLTKHIVFLGFAFFFVVMAEYTGFVPHTDLAAPPLMLYRSPVYVFIITCGVVGYMTYIGISSSNIFRKFFERKKALGAAMRSKKEAELYIDLMSHDLTNYNQALLGGIGLLEKKGGLDESQQRYVGICKRQVEKSERLITKVRAFSRAGAIDRAALSAQDLNACVEDAIATVGSAYSEKNPAIEFKPSGDIRVLGDDLLNTVVVNVIENAVKHNPGDGIRVKIIIGDAPENPDAMLEMRVEDNGPGIEDGMKEKIFDRYTRIGREKGIGLGLALARAVLEKYGGGICVADRAPGGGSVFIITIPKA